MKVLLIGDSIRMFYANEVKEQLGESYEIYAPKENCRFSSFVLNSLRFWLEDFPIPDVIHFNVGLWDTAILYHEDGCFTGLDEYTDTLDYSNAESSEDLRKSGIERLKELRATDVADISIIESDGITFDVGDIVGAKEYRSGISVAATVSQKIVKINNGAVRTEYKTGG